MWCGRNDTHRTLQSMGFHSKMTAFIKLLKKQPDELSLVTESYISISNSWLSASVLHRLRSKTSDLCELKHICVHMEFNDRRGISPVPLDLDKLRSEGKARGNNLRGITLLERKWTHTNGHCLFFLTRWYWPLIFLQ